ncbi:MAG TPA: guanylate kinase [Acetobacteraceae bacterium]
MTAIPRRGVCLVLAAPSGAGKSAIASALVASEQELRLSVSVTTRAPRAGEIDGLHYHFQTQAAFDHMVQSNGLLEWARVLGRHCYGTPRAPVEAALAAGLDMVFDIDWQGHRQLRAALPADVAGVFILPPDMATLEARLRARAGDDDAEIARRMQLAHDEISHWAEFDHVVVNDDLPRAIEAVRAVLHAARMATKRQTGLAEFVRGLVN